VDKQASGASSDAYEQLLEKAGELRRRKPSLTNKQVFAKVFADPENAEHAGCQRLVNRPVAAGRPADPSGLRPHSDRKGSGTGFQRITEYQLRAGRLEL
jgi:hypothetical protein